MTESFFEHARVVRSDPATLVQFTASRPNSANTSPSPHAGLDRQLLHTWRRLGICGHNGRHRVRVGCRAGQRQGGFAVLGAKLLWLPRADTEVELGVRNLGDKWYELSEGYPMPGRSWFANLNYRY
ncbi:MAG: TonB-dependent receptor [Dokdonella sp.]|nr:TonB-dependent receptor [Dokdonella sp.]MCC7255949.1 TonB-dependent receptor [Dokdonella sp.]